MRVELVDQLLLGLVAGDALLELPATEQHQRRDAQHAVFHHDIRVLVGIQLDDLDLALPILGELLDDRVDHLAGLAPPGGKFHQHGLLLVEDFALEIRLGYVFDLGHFASAEFLDAAYSRSITGCSFYRGYHPGAGSCGACEAAPSDAL